LADGRWVLVRRAQRGDEEAIQHFVRALSSQSRYERFFVPLHQLTEPMLERITRADDSDTVVMLALDGRAEVVGMAQYDVIEDAEAEAAVMVGEAWRRVGLAKLLLSDLAVVIAAAGIAHVRADILRENRAAIALARQVGCVIDTRSRDPYAIHVVRHLASGNARASI
jgi:GNAT superfamily N-acetyltransferase